MLVAVLWHWSVAADQMRWSRSNSHKEKSSNGPLGLMRNTLIYLFLYKATMMSDSVPRQTTKKRKARGGG